MVERNVEFKIAVQSRLRFSHVADPLRAVERDRPAPQQLLRPCDRRHPRVEQRDDAGLAGAAEVQGAAQVAVVAVRRVPAVPLRAGAGFRWNASSHLKYAGPRRCAYGVDVRPAGEDLLRKQPPVKPS